MVATAADGNSLVIRFIIYLSQAAFQNGAETAADRSKSNDVELAVGSGKVAHPSTAQHAAG